MLVASSMYAHASDESGSVLIGVFSGPTVDEHYAQSLVEMKRVDRSAASRGLPFVYVCVVDKDVARPPAVWRKRFSDANSGVESSRFYFVMVTTSMLIRGVFTAVNWLTAKREGQQYAVVSDIEEARRWLEAQHGIALPGLTSLEGRARAGLGLAV